MTVRFPERVAGGLLVAAPAAADALGAPPSSIVRATTTRRPSAADSRVVEPWATTTSAAPRRAIGSTGASSNSPGAGRQPIGAERLRPTRAPGPSPATVSRQSERRVRGRAFVSSTASPGIAAFSGECRVSARISSGAGAGAERWAVGSRPAISAAASARDSNACSNCGDAPRRERRRTAARSAAARSKTALGIRHDPRLEPAQHLARGLVGDQRSPAACLERRPVCMHHLVVPVDHRRSPRRSAASVARRQPPASSRPIRSARTRSRRLRRPGERARAGRASSPRRRPRRGARAGAPTARLDPPGSRLWSRQQTRSTPNSPRAHWIGIIAPLVLR